MKPLDGVLVLDLTRLLPGPFATQILADLGARVIKVEEPGTGDYARWIPPDVDGAGFSFSAVNRGKESVAINLKAPEGVAIVRKLAMKADVLVESFRPGVLDRLGLAPADLQRKNPRLVVLALSGYGQSGPMRDEVGHDVNYQAMAGLVAMTGPAERPVIPGATIADLTGGLYGVIAILAALRERDRSGKGATLDVALHDAALAVAGMYLARATAGEPVARGEMELAGALPAYNVYKCADDGWVALGALESKFWARFAEAVGRPEWEERHLDRAMAPELERLFATRGRDEWVATLVKAGVPATPVLVPAEVPTHPHVRARLGGAAVAVPGPASPITHRALEGRVPVLGDATDPVLRELGYGDAEIAQLRDGNVVA